MKRAIRNGKDNGMITAKSLDGTLTGILSNFYKYGQGIKEKDYIFLRESSWN